MLASIRTDSQFIEWDPKVRPEFVVASAEEIATVRNFVTTAMPRTTAPVEALSMVPTTFGSGKGKKLLEICN